MKHLSLEWCQKLKEWGFPQDCPNDKPLPYWAVITRSELYELYNPEDSDVIKYHRCPDLEELLEWAIKEKKVPMKIQSGLYQDAYRAYLLKGEIGYWIGYWADPDLKVAICHLLEQIFATERSQ